MILIKSVGCIGVKVVYDIINFNALITFAGVIDVDEMMIAFRELGMQIERPEAERLLKRYESIVSYGTID